VSDQERIAELEHRLRETNAVLARLASVVNQMSIEIRTLPGINRTAAAWHDVGELMREIEQSQRG
jgi:hypothetical protein